MSITEIGWIGTGVMGFYMCEHLIKAGYHLTIFNRTKSKAEALIGLGAKWVDSPKQVAEASQIICIMVGFPYDVRDVVLNQTNGVLAGCKEGDIICDFTTSTPTLAKNIYEEAKMKGVRTLDCPVSGGDVGAKEARLTIMCGGDKEAFDQMIPLFKIMGKTYNLMGGAGAGQHTKAVNQTIIASTMIGVCEGLLYAQRSGLDPTEVLNAVGGGAAASFSLSVYWPRVVKGDLSPGFFVKHFVKDLTIVCEECDKMGIVLPGVQKAKELYTMLRDEIEGGAEMGTQALIKVLEKINKKE
ncbi:putative 6-phosphogluconate dehydrogenase [Monocercomonoides exilis]|uniref:putative 6-phosphogluconate dehydrogenase n=1 Tax=Monocercomonoides exilis TaxID=2049356 RepID=UPI00355ABAA9|nr:putative 6-phosphogluconate dehydrogenase [Monocercomonoides exilis]|eukprot:MONOS_9538.1-p1 / transcript=MONOS_9538.1 / gene=MONOS_9538 / organism=Monocercomonoides_exilis_PA203 / gene_product=6-phosphogluconate dehydrogenase / transcript_product=6-phosphogluconate dehydrogenase / location=Mono_scaffold00397:53569-54714(-) / protein_length=298 / sequence_SO=supercontig / SO=protein_coding / is_pseudo=false